MSVLRALRELNPNQPANEFHPIRRIFEHAISPRRFFMLLVAAFAGVGLVLATLGTHPRSSGDNSNLIKLTPQEWEARRRRKMFRLISA
jgi:hypothetical protein